MQLYHPFMLTHKGFSFKLEFNLFVRKFNTEKNFEQKQDDRLF